MKFALNDKANYVHDYHDMGFWILFLFLCMNELNM